MTTEEIGEQLGIDVESFDWSQIAEIERGLDQGLSKDQVLIYADKSLYSFQMALLRHELVEGMSQEYVKFLANPNFDAAKIIRLSDGFRNGLDIPQAQICADERLDIRQRTEMVRGFTQNHLSLEIGKLMLENRLNDAQMRQVLLGKVHGLSDSNVRIYADHSLSNVQMCSLREALEKGVPADKVEQYASPSYTHEQMDAITKCLIEHKPLPDWAPKEIENAYEGFEFIRPGS